MRNVLRVFKRFVLRRFRLRRAAAVVMVMWTVAFIYGVVKPLPDGVSVDGQWRPGEVDFLTDLTYQSDTGSVVEQEIFERVFRMIDEAEQFVVIDMFLFNSEHAGDRSYITLTENFTDRLIEKRRVRPDVAVTFITDEINTFYGAYDSPELTSLEAAGVDVIYTRLTRLRDSNPLYSAIWRPFIQWFGTRGKGFLPHPLSSRGQKVTARSYLRLLNFKANHRKVIVTDRECLVASANPHTASSYHSNIAFTARGAVCGDVLAAEKDVATFSGGGVAATYEVESDTTSVLARYVTEGKIGAGVTAAIEGVGQGARIDIAMFYLSDRRIVRALIAAAGRGADVRLVLDPNKDAFGREKGGVPNRQVAHELVARSGGRIAARWYDTHGEQFHSKLVAVHTWDSLNVFGGSANLTRRNVRDYNLEADLELQVAADHPLAAEVTAYFNRIWSNDAGSYTVEYAIYRDTAWLKRVLYRFQEFTGLSSF